MCCFVGARPVSFIARLFDRPKPVHVAKTRIYARMQGTTQTLVYAMNLSAASEVAMVLPLPVVPGTGEDAVTFIDRSHDQRFFETLTSYFRSTEIGLPKSRGFAPQAFRQTLVVHTVGAFEASFVPTLADFDRLDARFRLPPDLFAKVPSYADYGFAVFKLAPAKKADVHPMAFTFPSRDSRLFFPTVHVHDGRVHADAHFDHELFYPATTSTTDERAEAPIALAYHPELAPLVDDGVVLARRKVLGVRVNADHWVPND